MELFQPDTRQGSKSLWLLANSRIQQRYAQVGELSLKPRETEHSNPLSLSPLHVKWMRWGWVGGGVSWHEKCLFSGSNHIGSRMIKALWQSSKFLVVCLCEKGRALHQGRASPLSSVCWNKFCISSGARQQTPSLPAVCHAALLHSARRLLPWLLSDAQHSAPCFRNNSGTDGWHSCSAGPHGLLKKAINQSRHSIQAGNWPIRVAQDAYVQADDFTNWLSIYTNTGTPQEKFTGCSQSINVFFFPGNRHHILVFWGPAA